MLLDPYSSIGEILNEFLLEITNEPLSFIFDFISPLTICFIYLFLRFNLARTAFFVVGVLVAKIVITIFFNFIPFASILLMPFINLIYLIGAGMFCAFSAYLCFKTFIMYNGLNISISTHYINWSLFRFGVLYALYFIGAIIDYAGLFAVAVHEAEWVEIINMYVIIVFAQVIEIVISGLIALIVYLIIKILPFKNAKKAAFLVLGLCFIAYLPVSIVFSTLF